MIAAAAALGVLALALAWPVPVLLSRADWPARSPATAVALWQGIALGGGLAMIGALLAFGASPAGSLTGAAAALLPYFASGPLPAGFGVVHLAALTLAVGLAAHLALNLGATAVRAERARRRQHRLVDLLGDPMPGSPGTRVLSHPVPVAYCVPGIRTATVLTDGLVDLLDDDELRAVLAHERAHLDQFHHLVLLAFRAWNGALPWFPIANRAERAVALLTEMLADDRARAVALLTEMLADDRARAAVGAEPLARALVQVGTAGEPGAYEDSGGVHPDPGMLEQRLVRLGRRATPVAAAVRTAWLATAVLIAATPVVVLASILV